MKERVIKEIDLGSEIADLLIVITTLANTYNLDVTKETQKFKIRLAKRHARGH